MIRVLLIIVVMLIVSSCKKEGAREYAVNSYGSRTSILNMGKLTATVSLDTLLKNNNSFYAIGPVDHLQGEITIYNNEVSISTIDNKVPVVSNSTDTGAIFLLSSNVPQWETYSIDKSKSGLENVEKFIKSQLSKHGRDINKATPFRIETTVPTLDYHIIFKKDSLPHNKELHHKAKRNFTLTDESVNIIGFWVDEARVGEFTHAGKRTHLHFISQDKSTSGHIDHIEIPAGSQLFLPKLD